MRKKIETVVSIAEGLVGVALLGAAFWTAKQSTLESDPHGFIFYVAFIVGIFGILTITCGLMFRKGKISKVASQLILIIALMLAYIELCTSYSGWWSI